MDPVTIATAALAILAPFARKSAEEFMRAAGEVGYERAKRLFATLKERWSGDEEASTVLTQFERKPGRYQGVLEEVLKEKLEADPGLTSELDQQLRDFGPELQVIQRMGVGEDVTGAEIGDVREGRIGVEQEIEEAKRVIGARIGTVGGRGGN